MALSVISIVLAILGLGFLVFIHELGHFWVARRRKMRVEAFSIGFGKPIYSWEKNGVRWQIGCLPFGGYVKIAGMQKEGSREPYEISDGFYGKSPWARIQVAFAGPLVNITFAFFMFCILWFAGGREKPFSEFTRRIGWVDPKSVLYEKGVRPGDVITKYGGRDFHEFKDLLIASVMSGETTQIEGYKVDYTTGKKIPFDYTLETYDDPRHLKDKLSTIGVLSPAQYLILAGPVSPGSPLENSGIRPNDRILWADGEIAFSIQQLSSVVNDSTAFLTVQRKDRIFHTKIPRVHLDDLKLSALDRAELDDWQHEAHLKGRLQDLYFIPYNLSPSAMVENRLEFIDEQDQTRAFQKCQRCAYFHPLEEGDQILAIEGVPIHSSYEILQQLQTRRVLLIVDRDPQEVQTTLWNKADAEFDAFQISDLKKIVSTVGTGTSVRDAGHLHLLNPVVPKPLLDLNLTEEQKLQYAKGVEEAKKEIEAMQDPIQRANALTQLEKSQSRLVLGLPLKDRTVVYNPNPLQQFANVFQDTYRTLAGLLSGYLNPKYVSGPIGIVHIVHQSWLVGAKEALFWMAVISLNLGLINLLPIPVLDGGHIIFALFESITKRRLRAKTMERLILPFVGALIALFIYITYQDLSRLFSKFF